MLEDKGEMSTCAGLVTGAVIPGILGSRRFCYYQPASRYFRIPQSQKNSLLSNLIFFKMLLRVDE